MFLHYQGGSQKKKMEKNDSNTVLIVDDDKFLTDSYKELLLKWHIESDEAENGTVALKKLIEKKYSLIFLDMQMNNKDGLEVLQEMDNLNKDTPIILITAYPWDERIKKALEHKIPLCLIKPISVGRLKKAVQCFIHIEEN